LQTAAFLQSLLSLGRKECRRTCNLTEQILWDGLAAISAFSCESNLNQLSYLNATSWTEANHPGMVKFTVTSFWSSRKSVGSNPDPRTLVPPGFVLSMDLVNSRDIPLQG